MKDTPKTNISESKRLLVKDFSMEDDLSSVKNIEELKSQITALVNHLLDNDLNKLLNALYKIDVTESNVKNVLLTGKPVNLAEEITDLIIERELQKVETRKKYSNS